jgi:hypothetical protein
MSGDVEEAVLATGCSNRRYRSAVTAAPAGDRLDVDHRNSFGRHATSHNLSINCRQSSHPCASPGQPLFVRESSADYFLFKRIGGRLRLQPDFRTGRLPRHTAWTFAALFRFSSRVVMHDSAY